MAGLVSARRHISSRDPQTAKLVILFVEDEWLIRAEITAQIERAGWQVIQASNGEDAVALLGRQVDVLITDIHLGAGLTGWEVADAFRAAHLQMPVIYTSADSRDRSKAVSGSRFLDKPYRPAAIVEAIRSARPDGL